MLFWNLLVSSFACLTRSMLLDGSSQECPQETSINPCTCSQDTIFQVSLSCSEGVNSANQLKQIFSNCSGRSFQEVKIDNVSVENIPAEIFETSKIQSLFIVSSSLTQLFNRPPKVQYKLHVLTLTSLEIQNGLDFSYFGGIRFLDMLSLNEINIPVIGNDFRDHVNSEITFLALEKTNTTAISCGAFSRLTKLRSLTIVDAQITALSRNILPNPSQIENIFLNYNKLSSLPDDFFSGMPNLKVVSLVGNDFSTVDQTIFAPAWSTLRYIGMYGGYMGTPFFKSAKARWTRTSGLIATSNGKSYCHYVADNPIYCDCKLQWLVRDDAADKVRGTCSSSGRSSDRDLQDLEAQDLEYCESES